MQDYKKHNVIPECFSRESITLFQGVFAPEALAKIKLAKNDHAFVCEGRPSLEAVRKTSAVLLKDGLTPTVISDNMAGFLFYKGLVKQVVIACQYADETGALCDTGALILAVLAKKHKVSIKLLEAEHKKRFIGDPKSILSFEGQLMAPKETHGYVPLVEWVAAKYLK